MRAAGWTAATIGCLVLAHWWVPAYALMVICALLVLGELEGKPARRRWRDSGNARKGWIHGR